MSRDLRNFRSLGWSAEWGAWVVDIQRPERFGIIEASTARKVWVVFDPDIWPPEKKRRDQLRQMTDDEINAWADRQPSPDPHRGRASSPGPAGEGRS